jgi:hypothetical protein
MGHKIIRISDTAHGSLRKMSRAEGKPVAALIDEAVEALRRQRFLEQVNAAYAAQRANPATWKSIDGERSEWEATLPDGLAQLGEDGSLAPEARLRSFDEATARQQPRSRAGHRARRGGRGWTRTEPNDRARPR